MVKTLYTFYYNIVFLHKNNNSWFHNSILVLIQQVIWFFLKWKQLK